MDEKKTENKICCFSGHRQLPQDRIQELTMELQCKILQMFDKGVVVFRTGGARGFDMLAAQSVLQLKQRYDIIKLELILPYKNRRLAAPEAGNFADVLSEADVIRYASEVYYRGCMHLRNRMLVDGSAYCIAYLTHAYGGTYYTVRYAQEHGVEVVFCGK